MPTVNIFYKNAAIHNLLSEVVPDLKIYLPKLLSSKAKKLTSNEVSIRIIKVNGIGMIGQVEIEITAPAFPDRVTKADEICLALRDYLETKYTDLGEVQVWLLLCELGHSWESPKTP